MHAERGVRIVGVASAAALAAALALSSIFTLAIAASASAAGGSIAFLRGGNIWLASSTGAGAHQLTTDGSYMSVSAAQGSGSPLLGFMRQTSAGTSYGVLSAAGGAPTAVSTSSQPAEQYFDANLNAAGTQLTYVYQYYDLSISAFRHVASIANVNGSSIAYYGTGYGVIDTAFADPNGSTLVWSGFIHDAFSTPDTCVTNQIGLGISTPKAGGGYDTGQPTVAICPAGKDTIQPAVSPDGTAIAARVVPIGTSGPGAVMVFPKSQGAAGTQVSPQGTDAYEPAWSPDGAAIAYAGSDNTVWTIPAGGGAASEILTDATHPAWTPYTFSQTPTPGPTPPTPGPPPGPAAGSPTTSGASLAGLAHGKPKLAFSVSAGRGAPGITSIAVSLPSGLRFAHRAKALLKGVRVLGARGGKATIKLGRGGLALLIAPAATSARVTIGPPALLASSGLEKASRGRHTRTLTVGLRVVDASGTATNLSLTLTVG